MMDKKAERLRNNNDSENHVLQVDVNKQLFTKFKIQCIKDGLTIKDKITEMIESSLRHL